MFGGDRDDLTICAVSTPFGYGGISVIRVSGENTLSAVQKFAPFLSKNPESHKVYFGTLIDSDLGEIDEVLITYFAKGKSFTGEEVIEISCHGSPLVCDLILKCLYRFGAYSALPGEFTYRAFLNGRLDLTQAESVISLIHSRSQKSSQVSLRHLKGDLSKQFESIESDMLWVLAHSEAQIDFSTEVVKAADESELLKKLSALDVRIDQLSRSFKDGRVINEGLRIALVGEPNVGKSSLYNILVQKDKAIVSDIPGTTRDLLETNILFEGAHINLVDTAGLRGETHDSIEKLGISRTLEEVKDADVVVWLHDCSLKNVDIERLKQVKGENFLFVGTKRDLVSPESELALKKELISAGILESGDDQRIIFVSKNATDTRDRLLSLICRLFVPALSNDDIYIVHHRQFEHLKEIQTALKNALSSMKSGVGYEFVSLELKRALIGVQEILGKTFDDQILDRVFKEFCIGK